MLLISNCGRAKCLVCISSKSTQRSTVSEPVIVYNVEVLVLINFQFRVEIVKLPVSWQLTNQLSLIKNNSVWSVTTTSCSWTNYRFSDMCLQHTHTNKQTLTQTHITWSARVSADPTPPLRQPHPPVPHIVTLHHLQPVTVSHTHTHTHTHTHINIQGHQPTRTHHHARTHNHLKHACSHRRLVT